MRIRLTLAAAMLPFLATIDGTRAASSDWQEVEGGRVRLVVEDSDPDGGPIRGALQVELRPGWKTYWRDPGDSGVPPSLTEADGSDFSVGEIEFPPPEWMEDGYSTWAGYRQSVDLPVALTPRGPDARHVAADAFLGICETICIPFQARFELTISPAAGSSPDTALVEQAFAGLPAPADEGFGVTEVKRADKELEVKTIGADGAAQLFLAGNGGYAFGHPVAGADGMFAVKIVARPRKAGGPVEIPYTLVGKSGAVSGSFTLE